MRCSTCSRLPPHSNVAVRSTRGRRLRSSSVSVSGLPASPSTVSRQLAASISGTL
jgi:hypothetical protein